MFYFWYRDSMATVRSLKIKTSTCKRLVKELHSYEKEVEREAAKTADMKDKGADPYDLKQQVCLNNVIDYALI
jgi:tubulin-specific chaperone A